MSICLKSGFMSNIYHLVQHGSKRRETSFGSDFKCSRFKSRNQIEAIQELGDGNSQVRNSLVT
ncbi:MAG TPA: hypothetical protein DEW32_14765 [Dehalococcoidia bacterium]|nr:hypothetical protein [Dehalococcoidia bacterium]